MACYPTRYLAAQNNLKCFTNESTMRAFWRHPLTLSEPILVIDSEQHCIKNSLPLQKLNGGFPQEVTLV